MCRVVENMWASVKFCIVCLTILLFVCLQAEELTKEDFKGSKVTSSSTKMSWIFWCLVSCPIVLIIFF